MKNFFLIIILILPSFSFAQKKGKVNNVERIIEYYNLLDKKNKPFFRYNAELPKLIIDAVKVGRLQPYDVYHDSIPRPVSKEEWLSRMTLWTNDGEESWLNDDSDGWENSGETVDTYYYLPKDASLIGLDITRGKRGNKEFRQINYINLYIPAEKREQGLVLYLASFDFGDVKSLLREKEALYYPLSKGIIYKNNITPSFDSFKEGVQEVLFKIIGEEDGSSKNELFFSFNETEKNGIYHPESVLFYKNIFGKYDASQGVEYIKTIGFSEWDQNFDDESNSILYMDDAITTGKLIPVSAENEFDQTVQKVAKSLPLLLSNNHDYQKTDLSKNLFSYQQVEFVSLEDTSNAILHRKGKEISRIIIDALKKGQLMAYKSDSLRNLMLIEEVQDQLYEEIYEEEMNGSWESEVASKVSTSPERLYNVRLLYDVIFNINGENKMYLFKGLGLIKPAKETQAGIYREIAYIKANQLKELLLNDTRAEFIKDSKTFNYWDLLEQRQLNGYLQSSQHLKIEKGR